MTEAARTPDAILEPEPEPEALGGGEALVASGATLMRVEHDAMLAVSVQRQRDKRGVLKSVLEDLELVPSLAERCFYVIPYKDRGRTVQVSGPSIHAARNIAREWGNCSARAIITGEDAEKVYLAGIFVDLQTNVRFERPLTVSRYLKKKSGERLKLNDQKLMQAIGAGASKAERNAILAGLPDWLVQSYDNKARKLAADQVRQNVSKMIEAFMEFGITRDKLEAYMETPLERMTDEQLADLRGIYNSLKDKMATVEEVFAEKPTEPADATGTVDDVVGAGADVTRGAEKAAPVTDWKGDPGSPRLTEKNADQIREKATSRALALGFDKGAGGTVLSCILEVGGVDDLSEVADALFETLAVAVEGYERP
ncbi:MAG: hypothetical protein ACYTAN_17710 [Planctomycetota bacterium]|jgi:hypothetical protein